jgi:cell division transport system permease protein
MKAIRVFLRSFREAFKSVFRNFSLSIASVTCTTITLVLVSIAILVSYNVNNVTNKLENELTIVVYLEREATQEQALSLKSEFEKIKNVEEVTYKSKDEWKFEMENYSATLNNTLSYLKENPLLDSYIVKVKDVKNLRKTADKIRKYEIVRSAEYGEGTVDRIVSIFDTTKQITLVIVAALVLVTAFLINNTIKLTIFSRRSEIEIMRLVGTSNYAIKLPFIFEGLFLGVIGSIIPVILTIYGYIIAYSKLDGHLFSKMISLVKPFGFVLYVSGILVVIGALVGVFGSYKAVRKYLKV